jgi:hypothetical protein
MGPWLVAGVGIVYAIASIEQVFKGQIPNAIIFAGYAFSNVGLYMLTR